MNLKKNMVLVVGGAVSLVLILAALVLLLRFHSSYKKVNDELQGAVNRLAFLQSRDPYPSEVNVERMQKEVESLDAYYTNLCDRLRQTQIEPEPMEPSQFQLLMGRTLRRLTDQALASAVKLPSRFAFGFDRYVKGELPASADIGRLQIQLKEVDELCNLLYKAKVHEILSVSREVFERGGESTGSASPSAGFSRRGQPAQDAGAGAPVARALSAGEQAGLFTREHFILSFTALDEVLKTVLNDMARSKMFMVVSRLELSNISKTMKKGADILPSPSAPAAPGFSLVGAPPAEGPPPVGAKDTAATREQRVLAGREPIQILLEVDIYRFATAQKEEVAP